MMEKRIVVTGILKSNDEYLIVQRSANDDLYPGAWEFPGGHLEEGEAIKDGLKRELFEEIGFNEEFEPIIMHYSDEVTGNYNLELDFLINVDKDKINIKLSSEHLSYKWVSKDSELLDDYIKDKLTNI